MAEYVHDQYGDHLRIFRILHGPDAGSIRAKIQKTNSNGEEWEASLGPVDPMAVIAAIRAECEMHEDDETTEAEPVQVTGEDAGVHRTPATAEEPRPWAGADEPLIDQILGRIGTLEEQALQQDEEVEAHSMLSDHWSRRLDVAREALKMIPAGKRGGMVAAIAGEDNPVENRVEKALKIARFAADEDRNIEGVDR